MRDRTCARPVVHDIQEITNWNQACQRCVQKNSIG